MELQKNNTSQENGMDHTSYLPEASLRPADILLPDMNVDMKKWAVIACDQFTAQPEYWKRVEDYVQDAPSMLRLIYPEIYLNTDDRQAYTDRIAAIQNEMSAYPERRSLKGTRTSGLRTDGAADFCGRTDWSGGRIGSGKI